MQVVVGTLTSDENVVDDDDKQRENVNDVSYESPESIKDVNKKIQNNAEKSSISIVGKSKLRIIVLVYWRQRFLE